MQDDQIRTVVLELLNAVVPGALEHDLDPKVSFRDQLEVDSVDFLNFVLRLQERLEVRVPEVDYPRLSTLNGCVGYLASLLAHRG